MSGHTPGPWRQLVTRIDDASGYQICHLDLHGKTEAERDANRRLIAAAPKLYEFVASAAAGGDNDAIAIMESIHGNT